MSEGITSAQVREFIEFVRKHAVKPWKDGNYYLDWKGNPIAEPTAEVATAKVLGDIEGLYQRGDAQARRISKIEQELARLRDRVDYSRAHEQYRVVPQEQPELDSPNFVPEAKPKACTCGVMGSSQHSIDCPVAYEAKPKSDRCDAIKRCVLPMDHPGECATVNTPEAKPKEASERWPVDYAKARNDAAEVKRLKEDVAAWIMRFAQNQAEVKRLTDQECYLMECLDGISHWSACDRNAITGGGRGVCLRCQLEDEQAEVKRLTEKNADQRRDVENYRDEVKRLNAAVQDEARKVMEREAEVKRLRETVARVEAFLPGIAHAASTNTPLDSADTLMRLRLALRGPVEEE